MLTLTNIRLDKLLVIPIDSIKIGRHIHDVTHRFLKAHITKPRELPLLWFLFTGYLF